MRKSVAAGTFLAAAVFTVVVVAAGCSPLTAPFDLEGVYSLKSVNGKPLPFALAQGGPTTVVVLNDAFILNAAGTYSEEGDKSYTTGGVVSVTFPVDAGSFTRRNNSVTLESLLFGMRPATISNGTLTMVEDSLTLVYQK